MARSDLSALADVTATPVESGSPGGFPTGILERDREVGSWVDTQFFKTLLRAQPEKRAIYRALEEDPETTARDWVRAVRLHRGDDGQWTDVFPEGGLPAVLAAIPGYMGGRAVGAMAGRGLGAAAAGAAGGSVAGPIGTAAGGLLGGALGTLLSREAAILMDPEQAGGPFFTTEMVYPGAIGTGGKLAGKILPGAVGRGLRKLPGLSQTTGYSDTRALLRALRGGAAEAAPQAAAQAAPRAIGPPPVLAGGGSSINEMAARQVERTPPVRPRQGFDLVERAKQRGRDIGGTLSRGKKAREKLASPEYQARLLERGIVPKAPKGVFPERPAAVLLAPSGEKLSDSALREALVPEIPPTASTLATAVPDQTNLLTQLRLMVEQMERAPKVRVKR